PAVFDLVNPGSTAETTTGVTTREVTAPGPNPKAFGFELRDGDTIRRLVVPRGEVLSPGQISSSESAMTMFELPVTVYPASDGVLYVEITNNPAAAEPISS